MSNHIQSRRRWQTATGGAIVLAVAAASLAAVATPAFSDPTSTTTTISTTPPPISPPVTVPAVPFSGLNRAKAFAAGLILERLNSLQVAIKKVQGDGFLGSDGATLVSEMQADITGLQTLGTTIAGETTLDEVLASIRLIYSEFRVYYLMLPVTADVVIVDYAVNVKLPALAASISLLQGAENSSNEGVLAPLIVNMQAQSGIITTATGGLSAQLLSYTPTEWNANHGLLNGARAEILVSDRAFGTAERDWQEASRYLRHHGGGSTTTTSTTSTTVPSTTTTTASGDLSKAQAYGEELVTDRVNSLNKAISEVKGDSFLGSDGTALVTELQADITALQGLGTAISGDTTVGQVNTDISQIFGYRVYDFLLPAVQDVVEVDSITNVKLPALATAITDLTGKENSSNQGVLAPLVSNMQSQSAAATTATGGLSAQLLGYTAADWNANHGLLNGARTQIFIADRALGTAWKDNQKANAYLRHHHNGGGGGTTTSTTASTTTTTA
ncbi:MAG: hypothetical protein ABSA91_18105 [Acidimicrobiales bacterium]